MLIMSNQHPAFLGQGVLNMALLGHASLAWLDVIDTSPCLLWNQDPRPKPAGNTALLQPVHRSNIAETFHKLRPGPDRQTDRQRAMSKFLAICTGIMMIRRHPATSLQPARWRQDDALRHSVASVQQQRVRPAQLKLPKFIQVSGFWLELAQPQ